MNENEVEDEVDDKHEHEDQEETDEEKVEEEDADEEADKDAHEEEEEVEEQESHRSRCYIDITSNSIKRPTSSYRHDHFRNQTATTDHGRSKVIYITKILLTKNNFIYHIITTSMINCL